MSGKRGPNSSRFGPRSGYSPAIPIRLTWSMINIRSPGTKSGCTAPAAFVTIKICAPRSGQRPQTGSQDHADSGSEGAARADRLGGAGNVLAGQVVHNVPLRRA